MPSVQNPMMSGFTILSAPPVGAYGSMPSPPSMFMQPPILSPGMQSIPGMGFTQGMVSPFTQFVNGVPWQPPTMPLTTASVSDHPCQGNGGSGCGCGGSCTGSTSNTSQTQQTQGASIMEPGNTIATSTPEIRSMLTPTGNAFLQNNFQIKLDTYGQKVVVGTQQSSKQTPQLNSASKQKSKLDQFVDSIDSSKVGNIFSVTCMYPTGVMESISAEVVDFRTVRVKITDVTQAKTTLDISYYRNSDNWAIGDKSSQVPVNTNLLQFGMGAWVAQYTMRSSIINFEKNLFGSGTPPQPQGSGDQTQPIDPCKDVPCIAHDLVCTFPEIPLPELGFTGPKIGILEPDQKTLEFFGFPCVGKIEANIGDCCREHDIAYWCAMSPDAKRTADSNVAKCIADALQAAIFAAYDNLGSILCMIGVTFFIDPLVILESLIDLALVHAETIAAIDLLLLPVFPGGDLLGYHGKNHLESCLCGGSCPTTPCPGNFAGIDESGNYNRLCRDLCKEFGLKDKNGIAIEKCYNCKWECIYQNGKIVGKQFDKGPVDTKGNPLQLCCPGTDVNCGAPLYAKGCCETCDWKCEQYPPGYWRWINVAPYQNRKGLPCCNQPTHPCPIPKDIHIA